MKIVYISSILPSGHFAQYFTQALNKQKKIQLTVYTDTNPKNKDVKECGTIKLVWSKSWKFIPQILSVLLGEHPDVIHIQQEFNMYGDIFTAALFPFLILCMKVMGNRVVVTIHAAVYKNQVNQEFIDLFTTRRSFVLNPFTLKIFFHYTYFLTSFFADTIICHTHLLKNILSSDYSVPKDKIVMIPTGIPPNALKQYPKKKYFFYFGYLVRRKGMDYLLSGFKKFIRTKRGQEYKLVLAGGVIQGQEKAYEEIKTLIKKLGLEKYTILKGFVEEGALKDLYSRATAVVIPAKVSMGSSGPLYQAQSFGKCIIASNIGHFQEDIKHLKDGYLVDNNNWEKALEFIIKNPEKVKQIEHEVRKKARIKSTNNIVKKHIVVYQHLYNAH